MTVNFLHSTLKTISQNGITCTNNGDGTYTLNGTSTSSSNTNFAMPVSPITYKGKCKLIGCPPNISNIAEIQSYYDGNWASKNTDHGNGVIFDYGNLLEWISIVVLPNATCNNLIFRPMLTTKLNADYDDFVPYTGNTGHINSDLAALVKRIEVLEAIHTSN